MHKPVGYYHVGSWWAEAQKLNNRPNPYPLGEFSKRVSDSLSNFIWCYIEDTGDLPTAKEYLEMCQKALESTVRA